MKRSPSASGRAGRAARDVVAVVVEDFRARAAGAGVAHRPEIVAAGDAENFLVGQAGDLLPQLEGVVVVDIDGDQEPLGRNREILGDQLPGERDGALLEVVAEGEIAQHLEEGVVARGIADIVEVVVLAAGAHAFLRGGGAHIGALFEAGEDVLELHHAGIGEHQRGVVARHQRRGRHDLVVVAREEIQEVFADIVDATHRNAVRAPSSYGAKSPRGLMFRGLFSDGGGVSPGRDSSFSPLCGGWRGPIRRAAMRASGKPALRHAPRSPGRLASSADRRLPACGERYRKTPSPPSSVAAALRSRVPTGANALRST